MGTLYKIVSIVGKDGKVRTGDPHDQIIGETVEVYHLKENEVAVLPLVSSDKGEYVRTSTVSGINNHNGVLTISTRNSKYSLKPVEGVIES